jgi:hypothetical protein
MWLNTAHCIQVYGKHGGLVNTTYVLYHHSKGMTHGGYSEALTNLVVKDWRRLLNVYTTHPEINKIGLAAGHIGLIWHNFWWVRASYLANSPEVMPHSAY